MSQSSPLRSAPIAIRRRGSTTPNQLDSDDDEEELCQSMDTLRLTTTNLLVGSLPTKQRGFVSKKTHTISSSMPAAPRLSSRNATVPPTKSPLLPRTTLSSQPTEGISYGSLRESQLEGRFLDGPASYRDRGSGEIRRLMGPSSLQASNKNERDFKGGFPASWQTPGERMQSTVASSTTPDKKSMLGDMMKDDSAEHRSNPTRELFGSFGSHYMQSTLHDRNFDDESSSMLSTSLTGLELLTRGDLMYRSTSDPPQSNSSKMAYSLSPPIQISESREHDELSSSENPDTEEAFDLDMD